MKKQSKNQRFNALERLETLSIKVKTSKFTEEFFNSIKDECSEICSFLKCSTEETALFSIILHLNLSYEDAQMGRICDYIDCSPFYLLSKAKNFEKLIELGYVRKTYRGRNRSRRSNSELDVVYTVDDEIINALINNSFMQTKALTNLNSLDFLYEVYQNVDSREENDESYIELLRNISKLKEANPNCLAVKAARQFMLSPEEEIFTYIVCYATIDSDEIGLNNLLNKMFDSERRKNSFKRSILNEQSKINKFELVKFASSLMRTDREMSMTEKGLDCFLGDEKNIFFSENAKLKDKEMTYPDSISKKEMCYNIKESKQIEELKNMLSNENYKMIKKRLKENNMLSAFTVLFHGYPGTGKTETVLQIARESGRPLFMIDVTKFKTCWFGESEKNLKKLFDKYREKVKISDIEPILLFNEADAVFAKRKDGNSSNVAQTENAIQNIILQEMETLDGILIATTNLAQNFDNAFERRFLYKICFEKPQLEVAFQIMKIRFPEMEENELKLLVEKYPFTGGQIENIARKYKMAIILNGIIPDINQLEQYCKDELLTNTNRKTLGFCIS
ncbi:MAG: ATP-binding protein [Bacteroidales bacterium]